MPNARSIPTCLKIKNSNKTLAFSITAPYKIKAAGFSRNRISNHCNKNVKIVEIEIVKVNEFAGKRSFPEKISWRRFQIFPLSRDRIASSTLTPPLPQGVPSGAFIRDHFTLSSSVLLLLYLHQNGLLQSLFGASNLTFASGFAKTFWQSSSKVNGDVCPEQDLFWHVYINKQLIHIKLFYILLIINFN